jgi:dethiobiotin synthetase
MNQTIIVTGTDTGIGKTVFAAALSGHLGASYWKPVQSGLDGETDSEAIVRLGGAPAERIIPEAYRLRTPASPHQAAKIDGVAIDAEGLSIPRLSSPLVIEGAGGLMVPLTERWTFLDVFARWRRPVVLCARTELGTINHTLLSLAALRRRAVPVLGVAFIGDAQPETERIIGAMGKATILGRLSWLEALNARELKTEFQAAFSGWELQGAS